MIISFALFLNTILSENPTDVIEKLNFFEKVVSPPQRYIEYFFCSWFNDFEISSRFFLLKEFLFPEPDTK